MNLNTQSEFKFTLLQNIEIDHTFEDRNFHFNQKDQHTVSQEFINMRKRRKHSFNTDIFQTFPSNKYLTRF